MPRGRDAAKFVDEEGRAGPGPSSSAFTNRPSLLPIKWQRLSKQIEGGEVDLSTSRANLTISDLIRRREARLAATKDDDVIDTDIYEPYEPGRKVPGWVGVPDPTKYAPGTTHLSPKELEEEIKKGNVVASHDWRAAVESLQPWQKEVLGQMVEADYADSRILFKFAPGEVDEHGGSISLVDLLGYVQHNPELEALVKAQKNIREGDEQGPRLHEALTPFRGLPNDELAMDLTREQTAALPWTSIGCGFVWRRRPVRWLKGWGGQMDFTYDVFLHERDTEKLLGPRWAQRPLREVYGDKQYWRDVLEAGPKLGMTFMVAAARDVPIPEACKTWADLIAGRLATRGVSEGKVSGYLSALATMLEPGRLCRETRLCNSLGTHLRQGSALMVTTMTEGRLLVQAMTPDPVRTRDYYVLGSIHGAAPLCEAFTSLALGNGPDSPQELPLDEDLLPVAQARVLAAINGYRAGAPELSGPNISVSGLYAPAVSRLGQPKPSMFKLPRLGQGQEALQPPTVLTDIQEAVTITKLHSVFLSAAMAADAAVETVPEGEGREKAVAARRDAAQAALSKGLAEMGLPGMTLMAGATETMLAAAGASAALSPALPVQPLQT